MIELNDWILTDNSTGQHVFRLSDKPAIFKVIDIVGFGCKEYTVYCGDVVVKPDSLDESTFTEQYLKPYGYDSYSEIKEIYGDAALQIVAECIFETDTYRCGDELYRGSLVSCLRFIGRYVKEHPNGG